MGVERVEDPSRVQGSALLGSKGQRPLVFLNQHAEEVCKCAQLNREMGVERVEDPSRSPEAEPLVGFKGQRPLRLPILG